jgi:hypothetical protein
MYTCGDACRFKTRRDGWLIIGVAAGLILLVLAAWLLIHYRLPRRAPASPPSHQPGSRCSDIHHDADGMDMEY